MKRASVALLLIARASAVGVKAEQATSRDTNAELVSSWGGPAPELLKQ